MRRTNKRQGSMLMMVMVLLIVAAIVAMKMMPDEQTQIIRENEAFNNTDLSQLREAIDLARQAAAASSTTGLLSDWEDFCATDTPDIISAKIASLSKWGFLRKKEIKDNTVPEHLWGTSSSQLYWKISTNYASNTSFEIASSDWVMSWEYDSRTASPSTIDEKKIIINSMAIDEYPYQNKLGDNTQGPSSIHMIRIDR